MATSLSFRLLLLPLPHSYPLACAFSPLGPSKISPFPHPNNPFSALDSVSSSYSSSRGRWASFRKNKVEFFYYFLLSWFCYLHFREAVNWKWRLFLSSMPFMGFEGMWVLCVSLFLRGEKLKKKKKKKEGFQLYGFLVFSNLELGCFEQNKNAYLFSNLWVGFALFWIICGF